MGFTALIKKIPVWIKIVISVITLSGMLYAGITRYDSFIINRAESSRLVKERIETDDARWNTVFQFIRTQTSHNERQDSISDIQSKRMLHMINTQINLKEYMMKNAPTKQDLQDVIDVFDYDRVNYDKYHQKNERNILIEPIK